MENKNGVSAIIATMLLVMLTIILAGIAWAVINGIVSKNINQSACYGNYNQVTLNNRYTCYNSTSDQVQFSVNVAGVNISGFNAAFSNNNESEAVRVNKTSAQVTNLSLYNLSTKIIVPGPNSGQTYLYNWTGINPPTSVQIAPIVNGQQCPVSDSIASVTDCLFLTG